MGKDRSDKSEAGGIRRLVVFCAVLMGAAALAYFLPLRNWLRVDRQSIAAMGDWVYPIGIAAVALLVGCGVPRLLLCGIGGMLLGFWAGLLVVLAGTLIGYDLVFLFTRWGGHDWILRRWPSLRKWADLVHDHGTIGVVLLRQLPIHGTVINLGLGLSHVKHRHFLMGTAIGSLPEAIPTTLAGAGLLGATFKASAAYLSIAVACLAVVWIGCGYMVRSMRQTRQGLAVMAEAASLKGSGD